MTIKANVKLTPELLITAPRRSPGVPNCLGTLVLYTVSTYNLDSHSEINEIRVLDVSTGSSLLFSDDPKNTAPQWLVKNLVLWQRSASGGATEFWAGSASGEKNAYFVGKVDAPVENVKVRELSDGSLAIGFSGYVGKEGKLVNMENAEKPRTSAREYGSIKVRFWDTYWKPEKSTLWYSVLERQSNGSYKLAKSDPVNALSGTDIEFPALPSEFAGEAGSYELAEPGLLVSALDPSVDLAVGFRAETWYIPVKDFSEPPSSLPKALKISGMHGDANAPKFSPDGRSAAILKKKEPDPFGFPFICVVPDLQKPEDVLYLSPVLGRSRDQDWDVAPDNVLWSNDGRALYVTAMEKAHHRLYRVNLPSPLPLGQVKAVPVALTGEGRVSSFYTLGNSASEKRLFITRTSLTDSSIYEVVDPDKVSSVVVSDLTRASAMLGLKGRSQVSEFWYPGAGSYKVQSFMTVPSTFDKNKKYPLLFLIHGGPQSCWEDAWSTRWNMAVFAEQGYVVVHPNPTGSTSFGFQFMDDILGDWGGRCYKDLENCFDFVEKTMPYVDTSRAVAAGGSFGGYMANYVAGQPLGRKFKALVSHDGIFSMFSMQASDVPIFNTKDAGAQLWDDPKRWAKYSPDQFTANWNTPMLVIHSDNDFRCPINEGLAAYQTCQMRGIESRFLNFPDETHFVLKRENSLQWYKTVCGWINHYSGNKDGIQLEDPITRLPFQKPEMTIPLR